MNVFNLRDRVIADYSDYVRSFVTIRNPRIRDLVEKELKDGLLWPEALLQLNPSFEAGLSIDDMCAAGMLQPQCADIFRRKGAGSSQPLNLHLHQQQAIEVAGSGEPYVLTTGTGSGKSLAYIIPIVDSILRRGSGQGVQAIIVYPMNALANSQLGELEKFLHEGFATGSRPVTFARYTGQDSQIQREQIVQNPPDIILTNFVMLELMLTRKRESELLRAMSGTRGSGLHWLVLDELHTYRGRQGSDVAVLVRRAREMTSGAALQCVGTSATIAGRGTRIEQKTKVAEVATQLFGVPVQPQNVIGETLSRFTTRRDFGDETQLRELTERLKVPAGELFIETLRDDPLAAWMEDTFGLVAAEEDGERFYKRATPQPISGPRGADNQLAELTKLPPEECEERIRDFLLAASQMQADQATGRSPFAFRLHQWLSRGDTVYASLEGPLEERYFTVQGQTLVPGSERTKRLFPLAFCRECGHEFYTVWRLADTLTPTFTPRALMDTHGHAAPEPKAIPGFLYASDVAPWPTDAEEVLRLLPDDWIEDHRGSPRIKRSQREYLPTPATVDALGESADGGLRCIWMAATLRFCPCCGVTYNSSQKSDFSKLSSLGNEGRSTATTILSFSVIAALRQDPELEAEAKKLLSFTDNRQDAALQAGHFNDFIETGLLRAALYRSVCRAGAEGLRHDQLPAAVFDSLQLPIAEYARDPLARFAAREEADRALRGLIGYRLFRDLRRGWRITSPNLEQCGLLEIDYVSLSELCEAEDVWARHHPALAAATPAKRRLVARVLCDVLRRELAIHDIHLEPQHQETMLNRAMQHLKAPPALWNFDEGEKLDRAALLYPRGREKSSSDSNFDFYLSPRGAFGKYVRRELFANEKPSQEDIQTVLQGLLEALREAGIVEKAHSYLRRPQRKRFKRDEPPEEAGYRLKAAALIWIAGDGTRVPHDPLRKPRLGFDGPDTSGRVNPFFTVFYREMARHLGSMEAREHTAQVPYDQRQDREERFGAAQLPVLYCSPTMELGVDIRQLNAVHLRNVPPTPANYAQRSGRAGRSGQPAIVWTYCTSGSPHDQYFFRRPELMVAGEVTPPRLDLANEDLVRAHIHALWLHESGADLKQSMRDVLDVSGETPSLSVQDHLRQAFIDSGVRLRARQRAVAVLDSLGDELAGAAWFSPQWLEMTLTGAFAAFDQACDRWRGLYQSAAYQRDAQHRLANDLSRAPADRELARKLRDEAERQLRLLTDVAEARHSDFYTYRYFASEGFLPGYNFPRLPLAAFIPGRGHRNEGEYLSRPRFLAISEFGPGAFIYHEGSRYIINRVILPPASTHQADGQPELLLEAFKRCDNCGFGHPVIKRTANDNVCEHCGAQLPVAWPNLLRLKNVATRRRDKINSDEEERTKLGYEITTSLRWPERDGALTVFHAEVQKNAGGGQPLAQLAFSQAATIWRINMGWKHRQDGQGNGFMLDVERGYWEKSELDEHEDPFSNRKALVLPYVEDAKNCLLLEPGGEPRSDGFMATLAYALKRGILGCYSLEDNELAVEPLPDKRRRRSLLFYEATEGGAGALKHLAETPDALANVARRALEACHFGDDNPDPEGNVCAAACYSCLLSYGNQPEHQLLDRFIVRDYLVALTAATTRESRPQVPTVADLAAVTQAEAGEAGDIPANLWRACESDLERKWLQQVAALGYRWPDEAQWLFPDCGVQADFYYRRSCAIFIDGPHHDGEGQAQHDKVRRAALEDAGITVLAFAYNDDWEAIFKQFPSIFGAASPRTAGPPREDI